jgi:hypothetical protein
VNDLDEIADALRALLARVEGMRAQRRRVPRRTVARPKAEQEFEPSERARAAARRALRRAGVMPGEGKRTTT